MGRLSCHAQRVAGYCLSVYLICPRHRLFTFDTIEKLSLLSHGPRVAAQEGGLLPLLGLGVYGPDQKIILIPHPCRREMFFVLAVANYCTLFLLMTAFEEIFVTQPDLLQDLREVIFELVILSVLPLACPQCPSLTIEIQAKMVGRYLVDVGEQVSVPRP